MLTFDKTEYKCISLNMESRLLLAAPSVPKTVLSPRSCMEYTGGIPLASFKLLPQLMAA